MLYAALASMSLRRAATYRTAALAGVLTNLFFGLVRSFIFVAVYRGAGVDRIGGYDVAQAVTYVALTQAMIVPLMAFGWFEVMDTIRSGDIAGDLVRPIDFYGFWLARDLGRAAMGVLLRGAPILLAFPLFYDLVWPTSAAAWAAFGLSALLAVLVSFSWRFLVNISAFWTTDAFGMGRVAFMSVLLLSGFVLPLSYFPDRASAVMMLLPFHAMVNAPAAVFVGLGGDRAIAGVLAVQAFWAVALALTARSAYRLGVSRLVIQGG